MKIFDFAPQTVAIYFDRWLTERNIRKIEEFIIRIAVFSFLIHLAAVWIVNHSGSSQAGHTLNYLRAIYTPFSFILVFEVFLLIIILPLSMSEFIGKQFEIITLITLRSFFHDIGNVSVQSPLHLGDTSMVLLGYDLLAALIMCALTVIFHRLHARAHDIPMQASLRRFVDLKKTVAAGLLITLLVMSVSSLSQWTYSIVPALMNSSEFPDPNQFFYADFFTIMIFADVLLLIISLHYDSSFYPVMRNASFVISTILVKLSLGLERPYNHVVAVLGVLFSVLIMLILWMRQKEQPVGPAR